MEISEAKELIEMVIREFNPTNKGIGYEIVPNLVNAYATYDEARYKICFNKRFIKRTKKDKLVDVILHELAHAHVENIKSLMKQNDLIDKMKQQSLGKYVNSIDFEHGRKWKKYYKILKDIYKEYNEERGE